MKNLNNYGINSGKAVTGAILIILGSILLIDNLITSVPGWVLSWPMLLIAIGLVSGVKHHFRRPGAFVLLFIGTVFLLDNYFLSVDFSIVWPSMLIGAGLWMIFRKGYATKCKDYNHHELQH